MINSPEKFSLPNCLLEDYSRALIDSAEESNELDYYRSKSNQFQKQNELLDEPEDNFWIWTLKGVLSLLVLYSLCVLVHRFIRICQRFKVYQGGRMAEQEPAVDELDENNNPITKKIDDQLIESNGHPIIRSSRRSGRISSQIVKLNQTDIVQVKLISLLILSATFAVLLVEITILVRSNSLLLITLLTAFTLLSMICNFKNSFDSIGQINFLIFLIERTLILSLNFVNRFNLYRGRKRRRCSIRID